MDWPDEFFVFLTWWQSLERRGHMAPSARRFEDDLPASVAISMFLLKRQRGGDFYICEIGDHLNADSLVDLRGSNYLSLFPGEQGAEMGAHLAQICGTPCGGDSIRTINQGNGRAVQVRHLLLPMTGENGIICYVSGCAVVLDRSGTLDRLPRGSRFDHITYVDIGAGVP